MKACSLDLRERIVKTYYGEKTSIRKVAERFRVSKSMVQNLIALKKETGQVVPRKATGGRKSQLNGYEEEIALMVQEYPDYTLSQYCEYWGEKTGIRVSESTMCRFLKKKNWNLKKNIHSVKGRLLNLGKSKGYHTGKK
jgi:transposase